jgi:hypothetical protein
MTRAELEAEAVACKAKIDAAYWAFSRSKRGKPPILVVPEAYQRLREINGLLRVTAPCGSVHLATKLNRRFHLLRLTCGCTVWVRVVAGLPVRQGRAELCERLHCREGGLGIRVGTAVAWLAFQDGPRQPSLFSEVA